jgi:hypothetical protein
VRSSLIYLAVWFLETVSFSPVLSLTPSNQELTCGIIRKETALLARLLWIVVLIGLAVAVTAILLSR